MSFELENATITTIGTCRIFHPIRLCAGPSAIFQHIQSPTYGYVHSSGEIVQQAKFIAGLQPIPLTIWPLVSDEIHRGPATDFDHQSAFFVVEISSLKDIKFQNWSVKGSRLDAMLGDYDLSRAFWLNGGADQRKDREAVLCEIAAFHALPDFKKEVVLDAYVKKQTKADIRSDLRILKKILPNILIVTHCNAIGLTGDVIEDRLKGTRLVKSAAKSLRLPTFEPEAVLQRWDQQQAMPIFGFDTAHYRMDFAREVGQAILSNIGGKPTQTTVRSASAPDQAPRKGQHVAVIGTEEARPFVDKWQIVDQAEDARDAAPSTIKKILRNANYADCVMLLHTAPPELSAIATPLIASALQRTLHLWCKNQEPVGIPEMVARFDALPLVGEAEVYRTLFLAIAAPRPLLDQIGELRAALSAAPQLAGLVGDVGRRAMSSGRLNSATCLLAAMVDYPEQRYAAGRALMKLYKLGFAALKESSSDEDYIERSELVLTLNPDQTGTIRSLAVALGRMGRIEEAVHYWDQLVANEPEYTPWRVSADRARTRLSRLGLKDQSAIAA